MDVFAKANAVDCQSCTQPFSCASIDPQWSTDALQRRLKLEISNLSDSGMVSSLDDQLNFPTKKSVRDPLSHRIIEKKRRDRMNNCLANLSSLLPSFYLKKSTGRVEKTEIIEMAITHLKYLQAQHSSNKKTVVDNCNNSNSDLELNESSLNSYCVGYKQCMSDVMHFLVEVEGFYGGNNICAQLLNHLSKNFENIRKRKKIKIALKTNRKDMDFVFNSTDCNSDTNFDMDNKNNINEEISRAIDTNDTHNEKDIDMPDNKTQETLTTNNHSDNYKMALEATIKNNNKNEEIYKYKTSIKHRFTADLQLQRPIKSEPNQINGSAMPALQPINPLTPILLSPSPPTVPMFVLHPRGNFYVPLVIDTHIVAPFFEPFKESLPVLHPINITVSFSPHPGEFESHEIRWMRPWEMTDPDYFSKKYAQSNGHEHSPVTNTI